jgi:hypothetical protein
LFLKPPSECKNFFQEFLEKPFVAPMWLKNSIKHYGQRVWENPWKFLNVSLARGKRKLVK